MGLTISNNSRRVLPHYAPNLDTIKMLFDIRTLIFVLAASNALIFLLIGSSSLGSRKDTNGMASWLWSYAAQSIGWSLLLLRGVVPDWISILFGNGLLIVSIALIYRAIRSFLDRAITVRTTLLHVAIFQIGFVALAFSNLPRTLMVAWVSLAGGGLALACAWELLRGIRRKAFPARWTTGVWLGAGGIVICARGITALFFPSANHDVFTQSMAQVVAFLISYSAMLGASFGFNLMLQERSTHILEQIARLDDLTGLYNRRHFLDKVRIELNRMKRRNSADLVLMMLDIDHFKEVNDHYGHAAGDNLLKKFAAQLSALLREPDVVARYGGEEFCVLLPDTNLDKGSQVAERLRLAAYDAGITIGDKTLVRTISIGVASANVNTLPDLDALFLAADRALYQAKQEGRNRIVCAEERNIKTAAV
jgi:diguanylate cyclase (GGDEF)-like protein